MATALERETTVTMSDGDPLVHIYTMQAKFINRLKKNPRVTLLDEGVYENSPWASFSVPKDEYSPVSGVKGKPRAPLTTEQKQAAADRMKKARDARA